jgi:LmbE family N-acetylglucosaminyl deacetylase
VAGSGLPPARSVLAVCAHPDDESFGLGAVIDAFSSRGARVSVLCLTHGEASTLHGSADDLFTTRAAELRCAAAKLGVERVELYDHPDGGLPEEPLDVLAAEVAGCAREVGADLLLVFDEGGVTGHADHDRATSAALAGAAHLPVLAWTLPESVAAELRSQYGGGFLGRREGEIDAVLTVDRRRQLDAIGCHASQSNDNPVLWRRLDLLGATESLRWLRRPAERSGPLRRAS